MTLHKAVTQYASENVTVGGHRVLSKRPGPPSRTTAITVLKTFLLRKEDYSR